MAYAIQETNMAKIQNSNLFTLFATVSGIVVGVVVSLAIMAPALRAQATQVLNARPTSTVATCASPNDAGGAANNAKVKTSAVMPAGGQGGGQQGGMGGGGFTHQLVAGSFTANTSASIGDTGPNSVNKITTHNENTTTVTNNNNVTVSNSNTQTATSGSANVSGNTNAGSANSGQADNWNDTETNLNISN